MDTGCPLRATCWIRCCPSIETSQQASSSHFIEEETQAPRGTVTRPRLPKVTGQSHIPALWRPPALHPVLLAREAFRGDELICDPATLRSVRYIFREGLFRGWRAPKKAHVGRCLRDRVLCCFLFFFLINQIFILKVLLSSKIYIYIVQGVGVFRLETKN